MVGRWSLVVVIVASSALAGCVGSSSKSCPSGRVCPAGTQCVSFGCVLPSQLAACSGLADASACTLPDKKMGQCREGACITIGCGNGIVEAGEACDDGNQLGGDGCSARCDSDESCGNAFLD